MTSLEHCQFCHKLSYRKCALCNVCSFCSEKCEQNAEDRCRGRVACTMHIQNPAVEGNLDLDKIRIQMLPYLETSVTRPWKSSEMRWDALFHGAKHFLHLLLANTNSRLYVNTAFGMSIVLSHNGYLCAGFERLVFHGTRDAAASRATRNAGKLAWKTIQWNEASYPTVEPKTFRATEVYEDRAILVVARLSLSTLHFDACFVTRTDGDSWTIQHIRPLWAQRLVPDGDNFYKMHFKPMGMVPSSTLLRLELAERGLSPPEQAPVHPPRDAPPAPNSAPPQAPPPTPRPASANHTATAQGWEQFRLQELQKAQDQAQAQVVAPPWTEQLRMALEG